jgi:hypothetical protein
MDGELFAVGSHNTLRLCDKAGVCRCSTSILAYFNVEQMGIAAHIVHCIVCAVVLFDGEAQHWQRV